MSSDREQNLQTVGLRQERLAALGLLRSAYLGVPAAQLARQVVILARAYSGCEAVAIRLRKGPDFPYEASLGFDPEFIGAEGSVCALDNLGQIVRDDHWHPALECMCGTVLSGRTDASKPCFTAAGSFCTSSTTDLLEGAAPVEPPARTRNRCHAAGYESVGLFPIRLGDNTFGLIQCNDWRRDRFNAEIVELMEELAATAAHLFQLSML